MAKICEYEQVKCPFCGNEEVEHYHYGELKYMESQHNLTVKKVHIIHCGACLGQFAIPCED